MTQKKSLRNSLMVMAIMPIIILGILVALISMQRISKALHKQVESELTDIAYAVSDMMDIVFPGDYRVVGEKVQALVKGEYILNDRSEFIDSIMRDTGLEISLFYMERRFLSTICDQDGNRIVGTKSHSVVQREVLETGTAKFYDSVNIDSTEYFAYYLPLKNSDGSCVGLIGVAKPAKEVKSMIYQSFFPIMIMSLLVVIIAAVGTALYARRLIVDLTKLKNFLQEVAKGNLKTEFDYELMKREDEITDMVKSAGHMQKSLRELIELDALTQLENRRSANANMAILQKKLVEEKQPYILVLGDIDFFKKVNDNYGHDAGDEVLKKVASILKAHMKGKGFASRWGGEEFLLGFKDYRIEDAKKVVEGILDEIRGSEIHCGDQVIKVTMSFGVAAAKPDQNIDTNVKAADNLLYEAKESGRNRVISEQSNEKNEGDLQSENVEHTLDVADNIQEEAEDTPQINEEIMEYINEINNNETKNKEE